MLRLSGMRLRKTPEPDAQIPGPDTQIPDQNMANKNGVPRDSQREGLKVKGVHGSAEAEKATRLRRNDILPSLQIVRCPLTP